MEPGISIEDATQILSENFPNGSSTKINGNLEAEQQWSELEEKRIMATLLAEEKREIIKMRKQWSVWLLRAIIAIVLFDFFVMIAVGFRWMKFDDNIVPIFIGESFLKTIGLALIVVAFLFNKNSIGKNKQ